MIVIRKSLLLLFVNRKKMIESVNYNDQGWDVLKHSKICIFGEKSNFDDILNFKEKVLLTYRVLYFTMTLLTYSYLL